MSAWYITKECVVCALWGAVWLPLYVHHLPLSSVFHQVFISSPDSYSDESKVNEISETGLHSSRREGSCIPIHTCQVCHLRLSEDSGRK